MRDLRDQSGRGKSFLDVVALEVDVRIDLVGDPVVALVAFEADIVSCRADPKRFPVHLKRSLPDAQVVA